jgi:hypothetical protein
MTVFAETALRHMCRNPKCRSKLPVPVGNDREAFCARGCHSAFYRHRCLVCEEPMERKTEHQLICGKRRCRNALQGAENFGRYHTPSSAVSPSKKPVNTGPKPSPMTDRPWHIAAGPALSADQPRAATVPDGPGSRWEGGEYRRIEAKNRAALKAAEQAEIEVNGEFTEPEWRGVTSPDGVGCFVTRFRDAPQRRAEAESKPAAQLAEDLTIPPFLDRRPKSEPQEARRGDRAGRSGGYRGTRKRQLMTAGEPTRCPRSESGKIRTRGYGLKKFAPAATTSGHRR